MINLEADLAEQCAVLNERKWSSLQSEVAMNIANAPFFAFQDEAQRMAEFVRLSLLTRAEAADILHTAAVYGSLYCSYGRDRIQNVMAAALESRAA
jgi:hypothetical protein